MCKLYRVYADVQITQGELILCDSNVENPQMIKKNASLVNNTTPDADLVKSFLCVLITSLCPISFHCKCNMFIYVFLFGGIIYEPWLKEHSMHVYDFDDASF